MTTRHPHTRTQRAKRGLPGGSTTAVAWTEVAEPGSRVCGQTAAGPR